MRSCATLPARWQPEARKWERYLGVLKGKTVGIFGVGAIAASAPVAEVQVLGIASSASRPRCATWEASTAWSTATSSSVSSGLDFLVLLTDSSPNARQTRANTWLRGDEPSRLVSSPARASSTKARAGELARELSPG